MLRRRPCQEGEKTLILEGSQLGLQIHESVGHAIELDRILGWEAAFAGTSHLELPKLGTHRYGSELMNITADATLPGALGTFGYDDEGTPCAAGRHRRRTAPGSGCSLDETRQRSPGSLPAAWCGPTASTGCRWCG